MKDICKRSLVGLLVVLMLVAIPTCMFLTGNSFLPF